MKSAASRALRSTDTKGDWGEALGVASQYPSRPAVLGQADAVADKRIALLVARRHQAGRGKRLERERERPVLPFPLFFVEHDRQMQHLAQAQHGADAEILEVGKVALPANVGFGCPERKGPLHPFAEFAGALGGDAEHVGGDARLRDKAPSRWRCPEMASTAECAAQSLAARSAARRCMTSRSRDSPSGECTCGPRQPEMEPR